MRIVVAPDKFKGCLPAEAVARHIAAGLLRTFPGAEIDLCPLADGGEGFVEAMLAATGGTAHTSRVVGPLPDQTVDARWGFLGDGTTAVIEMSAASGYALVPADQRNPMNTTTYGTGQLLLHAARKGAQRLLLGIGGSATVDAGLGCCQAAGHTVLRFDGETVPPGDPLCGRDLPDIHSIKRGRGSELDRIPIIVACDVDNPLYGDRGAAVVFGPQKGATPEQVAWFDAQHRALAERCLKQSEALSPGTGAAGGLGWALTSFFNAQLVPGIRMVMDATGLAERLRGAALCVTGEGAYDGQSAGGKTASGVARFCAELGIPCVLLAGRISADTQGAFAQAIEVSPRSMSLDEAFTRAPELLTKAAESVTRRVRDNARQNTDESR
jgi:glycerate kinase